MPPDAAPVGSSPTQSYPSDQVVPQVSNPPRVYRYLTPEAPVKFRTTPAWCFRTPPPRLPSTDAGGSLQISDGSPVENLVPPPRLPSTDAGGYGKIPRGQAKTAVPTLDRRLRSQAVPSSAEGTVGELLVAPERPVLLPDAGGAAKIPRTPSSASDSTPTVDPNQHPALQDGSGPVGDILAATPRPPIHPDAGGSAKIPRFPLTSTSTSTVDPRWQPVP